MKPHSFPLCWAVGNIYDIDVLKVEQIKPNCLCDSMRTKSCKQ